jgi:hypothetical protein
MRTMATARTALLVLWLAAMLPAQDEPKPDPALPDQLKELKTLVSDPKMQSDFQAIGLMQKLVADVDKRHEKDLERMAKAFGEVFRTGKVRTDAQDILYREASDALSKLGEEGSKELRKALDNNRFKDAIPLQEHMILALGRTQDEKQVDWLLDLATRSHRDELRAASGEALGNYTKLEIKARRDAVKTLIRELGGLHQQASVPILDVTTPGGTQVQNAQRTLRAIEAKWTSTLEKLTGVSHSSFPEWQRWLNKNPNWTPPEPPKPAK